MDDIIDPKMDRVGGELPPNSAGDCRIWELAYNGQLGGVARRNNGDSPRCPFPRTHDLGRSARVNEGIPLRSL
jgi:hypothetical protein